MNEVTVLGNGQELIPLGRDEARALVEEIRSHLLNARAKLLLLYERQGWLSLGYTSWAECVEQEFGKSRSYLYRQLAAAQIEKGVGAPVGEHLESHMRAIGEVLSDDEDRKVAYESGLARGANTALEWSRVAMEVWLERNLPPTSPVIARLRSGEMGARAAYEIGRVVVLLREQPVVDEALVMAVEQCTDPDLAHGLVTVYNNIPALWAEIVATGCVPSIDDGQTPISKATARQLQAYLTIDSAERRAVAVESAREYYDERQRLTTAVLDAARRMCRDYPESKKHDDGDAFAGLVAEMCRLLEALDRLENQRRNGNGNGAGR